jgi:multisubunit Na+/H+ antiporter MnhE subunit
VNRLVLSVAFLALIYVLTLASIEPWDLALGVLLAVGLLALFRNVTIGHRPTPLPDLPGRLLAFLPLLGQVAVHVVRDSWHVALVILHRVPPRPGIVAIPIGTRSHRGVAVTALLTTLSPGSFFIDVDWDRDEMLFHFLDASDPPAIRASLARLYDRYQRHVFP